MADWWDDPAFESNTTRDPWERFKDAYISSSLHNPLGGEGAMRYLGLGRPKGITDEQLNAAERRLSEKYKRKEEADPIFKGKGFDAVSPENIGRLVTDLAGSLLGGADPSYVIAPGRRAATRILSQATVNADVDAVGQLIEKKRGVRDELDPIQTLTNAIVGGGMQGAGEAVAKVRVGKMINSGAKDPEFNDLLGTIKHLEGGGTLAAPKTSPKGALGPMQVMMATARDPGFGIRPWNGKTQEDLVRVGTQYAAALNHKYGGDKAKVLAAYNAGPGRVDKAIKLHGDRWAASMPTETRGYIRNGLRKLGVPDHDDRFLDAMSDDEFKRYAGVDQPPLEIDPAIRKEMDEVFDEEGVANDLIAKADDDFHQTDMEGNRWLADGSRREDVDKALQESDNVVDLDQANDSNNIVNINAFKTKRTLKDFDDSLENAHLIHDAIKNRDYDNYDVPTRDELHDAMDNIENVLDSWHEHPEAQEKLMKEHDLYRKAENMLYEDEIGPIASKGDIDPLDSYHEKFTPYVEKPNTPANDPKAKRSVGQILKDLLKNDSGSYRDTVADPTNDAETRMIAALKAARPVTAAQRAAYRQARAERAGHIDKLQQEGGGTTNFKQQAGALKGSLPKIDFESIAEHFNEEDIKELSNKINFSKALLPLEKFKALSALHKLLAPEGAKVPTPGELRLLSQVYSPEFVSTMLSNRSLMEKIGRGAANALNVPRALMASVDLSAPFRQGVFMVGRKEFYKSFANMFKLIGSEKASKALLSEIHSRPTWEAMKKSGLAIVDPHSHFLNEREEDFMSDWAEKIPLAGSLVKASNRAYSGFLNKLRADVFDDFVKKYDAQGVDLLRDKKRLKDVTSFINAATGRGTLGKQGNAAAPFLNNVFFSPRLIASRVQMLNPVAYAKYDPLVRKEALKSLFSFTALSMTVAGLAKYGLGMDVEDNPLSSNFMKPRMKAEGGLKGAASAAPAIFGVGVQTYDGETRYDILGGFQQYIRLAAQMMTGKTVTGKGEERDLTDGKFGMDTRRDVALRFGLNKLAPVPSYISAWMEGKEPSGEEFEAIDAMFQRMLPLTGQDIHDAYANPETKTKTKESKKDDEWWNDPIFGSGPKTTSKKDDEWWNDPAFGNSP